MLPPVPDAPAFLGTSNRLHSLHTSFGGIPAAQIWADYYLWELLLNEHPVEQIIEIGTWKGGFAEYLFAQATVRDIKFQTFDVVDPEHFAPNFTQLDVFAVSWVVIEEIKKAPVALLCDGGNKPREMRIFTKEMPEGSIVVVHDWLTEAFPEDVPDWLTMIHEDVCEEIGSMSRVFTCQG